MQAAGSDTLRADRITRLLQDALHPARLEVEDDSAKHAGHAGAAAGGQTHYTVRIVADRFSGLNRVARYRIVHETLAAEFATGLHALSLELRAPDDAMSKNSNPVSKTLHKHVIMGQRYILYDKPVSERSRGWQQAY